jgi:hypothetical protein
MGTLTILIAVLVLAMVGVAYVADRRDGCASQCSATRDHACGTEKRVPRGLAATLSPLGTKSNTKRNSVSVGDPRASLST